LTNFYPGI